MPDTPLNPDALANLRLLADRATEEVRHAVIEPDILHKLLDLAVAQPVVTSVEELDKLPGGSLVRSGGREFYKTSYVELPWILPYGVDRFGSSYLAKHSKVTVIHRPAVKP